MAQEVVLNEDFNPNEKFNKYDDMTYAATVNLYSLAKQNGRLALAVFDPDNDDHQFFLHTALVVKDLIGYQPEIKCSFWKWLKTNWGLRKSGLRVRRYRNKTSGDVIYLNELMEFMTPLIEQFHMPEGFTYGDIYQEYYQKGYDKK